MIAFLLRITGLSQFAIEAILIGVVATSCFATGYEVESWRRDSQELKELQETEKQNDALKTAAIQYEKDITKMRQDNEDLQDEARKTPSDPVCGSKQLPTGRLQLLRKTYPKRANELPKAVS